MRAYPPKIVAALLLALALAGCVETRSRAHAQCEAQFIATGMRKEDSRRMSLQLACMRAAGYRVAEECMPLTLAVTVSVGCFVPVGTVERWVFNVDHVLRPPPPAEIKCELESCPLLDELRSKGLVGPLKP